MMTSDLRAPGAAPLAIDGADVLRLPRERLVPLLYEHLVRHLEAAAECIEQRDFEGKTYHLERALSILFELLATLDFERGGEVAPRLAALYSYFTSEIIGIGRSLDVELLRRITGMIAGLHESWEQVAACPAPASTA